MRVKNALFYCGLSREDFNAIRPLVAERNYSFFKIISVAMTAFGAAFLIAQSIIGTLTLVPYIFILACGVVFWLSWVLWRKKSEGITLLLSYLQMCSILVYAMMLSAQGSNVHSPATSIIVFLSLLPLTINDRPIRMTAVVTAFSAGFLFLSYRLKPFSVFGTDVMNTLTFLILGMGLYLMISNRNVHEIYLRQKTAETDRLREQKRAAELANAAKSDFLASMSHEIRTPINAVLGMNEMILRESRQARELPTGDARAVQKAFENISVYAGDVESAGSSLLAIINDILDFSKIEAGRMDIVEAPYDLSSLLNDLSNMTVFRAKDKGLEFAVDVDETLPDKLCGDKVRVRQVATNLLSNAVKYTERGSVRLSVRGERRGDDTIVLTLAVRDTGIGIRQEDADKLFTKFQRLDLQRNSTVEGTGLGLVITHRLLEMMGGSIDVRSEYGRGSTFTVTLPQKILSDEAIGDFQKRFQTNLLSSETYRVSFRAPLGRILIVDDTRMNLTVAIRLLKDTELRIDTALSGAEAIALAREKAYDVILMDQRMPEMDGTEALHRIRADETGANGTTPVICLTADAVIGAKERYLAEGFSDYLTKPIDSHALERMLMRFLPPEKVLPVQKAGDADGASDGSGGNGADGFAPLRAAGLDPQLGLRYCQNDAAFYRSLLAEFAKGADEKAECLRRCLAEEDWKDYAVFAHALKSTSKTIGASGLSGTAAKLEAAAAAGDGAAVRAAHGGFLARVAALAGAIRAALPEEAEESGDGDEVLEFTPEPDAAPQ